MILISLKQQQADVADLLSKTPTDSNLVDQEPLLRQLMVRIETLIPRAEEGVTIITVRLAQIEYYIL